MAKLRPAAGASGTASAKVVEALVIAGQTPLHFGIINSASGTGSLTVSPQNTLTVQGNITVPTTGKNSFQHAVVDITGSPNTSYHIHLPDQLQFTKEGSASVSGVTTLNVTDFTSYSINAGQLDNTGNDTIYVGGTLMVPSTTASGSYSGEVPVTLSY